MTAEKYKSLIQSFVNKEVSVDEFENRYLAIFKAEPKGMNPELFKIIDQLFSDVDAYSPSCSPDQETPFRISEASLAKRASLALEALEQLPVKH